MFARAFEETLGTSETIQIKPKKEKPVPLAQNPSFQTYISKPKIHEDALINRQLQAVPLGGTRKDTWLGALLPAAHSPQIQSSKFSDFQHTATLGMDQTISVRNQATHKALEGRQNQIQSATPSQKNIEYTKNRIVYKKDTMEQYDFCAEIHDTARPPYHIDCLRKEFLREGGQPGAALFPSEENLKFWNSHSTWLKVKGFIKALSESTDSMNKQVQKKATLDFYGIILDPKSDEPFQGDPGLEVFWFTHSLNLTDPTTFLGRRVRTTVPFMNKPVSEKDGSPTKKDLLSITYFTSLKVYDDLPIFIRVTADDGFGTHFNGRITGYYNNKRVNGPRELTSLTYMTPTTFTMKEEWLLTPKGPNCLTGYYHQGIGGLYYKLELWDGDKWSEIPERMLTLTRDPFAPMFSFEVDKDYASHGCDYQFCDQRFGGYKMKWKPQPGGGPNWSYSVVPNKEYPFGKHAMLFYPGGGGIMSHFSMKLYSFMTMTLLVRIQELPSKVNDIFTFHSPLGQISIRLTPLEDSVSVSLVTLKHGSTKENPIMQIGQPHIIVVRMLRNDYDIYSLDSIQLGIMSLRGLQIRPEEIKQSKVLKFEDPRFLENPDSKNAYTLYLGGHTRMIVYWLRFFDYVLKPEHLKDDAFDSWKICSENL